MNLRLKLIILLIFISLFLNVSGCSDQKAPQATLVFSSSLKISDNTSNVNFSRFAKNKTGVHKTDLADITSLSITVTDMDDAFSVTETMTAGINTLSFTVPASTPLIISGAAFQGDVRRFSGGSKVDPIDPGISRNVSFFMYSQDAEPILVDIGLANKPADGPSAGSRLLLNKNYVLFTSAASNLVEEDNNESSDLFLRDLDSNKIIKINSNSSGDLASGSGIDLISEAAISSDGRYVVFASKANNLVDADTNQVSDIFLKDTTTGLTKRISLVDGITQADKASYQPDISNDGQIISFYSEADLSGNGGGRLFIYNRITQTISASILNVKNPKLSGDGSKLVYVDSISQDLSLLDLKSNEVSSIISSTSTNDETSSSTPIFYEYEIENMGQFVVLVSNTNVGSTLKNHIYLYDVELGSFLLVSKNNDTPLTIEDVELRTPSLSADARYVIFRFNGTIYVKDISSDLLEPVADGLNPFLSLDGQRIGYTDFVGRVLLKNNPLYNTSVSTAPSTPLSRPSQLIASFEKESSRLEISWDAVENSKYYRVYIASESGVTPSNYFSLNNGIQYETLEAQITISVDSANQGIVYAVVTVVTDNGEGLPSDELKFALPFEVTSSFPTMNAINVPAGTRPRINFNRDVNTDTVNTNSFTLFEGEEMITGSLNFPESNSIEFIPNQPLNAGGQYSINISDAITDIFGVAITNAFTIPFTVAPPVIVNASVDVVITGSGSVNPSTSQIVMLGETTRFTLEPALGYSVGRVDGCGGTLVENIYTTGLIQANCKVTVNFVIDTFTLSYSAGNNGSLSGIVFQTVDYNGNGTEIRAIPATGYEFSIWSDGRTDNPRRDRNVTNNILVSASFRKVLFTVNINVGNGGSINPITTNFSILYGDTFTFTVKADLTFQITSVDGCNGSLSGNSFTSGSVVASCTVDVLFFQNQRPILSSPEQVLFPENELDITTISAQDTDTVTYRLNGGADLSFFTIDSTTGLLSFNVARDYENKMDANADNTYEVNVVANDGQLDSNTGTVLVTIRNVQEVGPILNDTGFYVCKSATGRISCLGAAATYPNQDAHVGRDVDFPDRTNGLRGFDFTKIASFGIDLPVSEINWSCIRDNVTGLMWEKKSFGGVSLNTNTYTWTGTKYFVNTINNNKLCGFTDWRLPTVTELVSITAYGNSSPAIDETYFKYSNSSTYWTSSEKAYLGKLDYAYTVNFSTGSTSNYSKNTRLSIRLVRGSQK